MSSSPQLFLPSASRKRRRLISSVLILGGLVVALVALLVSCSANPPKGVPGKKKMENVLYDYHVALALGKTRSDSADFYTRLYTRAALSKYGMTEDDLDEALKYYVTHADKLFDIYGNLNERFATAAAAQGLGDAPSGTPVANMMLGDSANIWTGAPLYLLSTQGSNYVAHVQDGDTTLIGGDELLWHLRADWRGADDVRSMVAVATIIYENDSAATFFQRLRRDGYVNLKINVAPLPVRNMAFHVFLSEQYSDPAHLLVVSDISLARISKEEQ